MKFELTGRYPFLRVIAFDVDEKLRRSLLANEELREKLVATQKTKATAVAQAEELRGEKERLRTKIATMKHDLAREGKVADQLREKITALQAELDEAMMKR